MITEAEIIIADYVKTALMKQSMIIIAPIITALIMTSAIYTKDMHK